MDEISNDDIREMLAHHRPDRYKAGSITWAAPVVELVAGSLNEATARRRSAEQIVKGIEDASTRSTNKFMRKVLEAGALPLDWQMWADQPLSVGTDRVCIRSVTPDDLDESANIEERKADSDYEARIATVNGARLLRDLCRENQCHDITELGLLQEHA